MAKFYVGQPVLCVDGDFARASVRVPNVTWPVEGRTYVVRAYVCGGLYPGIVVREITNRVVPYNGLWAGTGRNFKAEASFWDERFVPATDIGVLEKLLTRTDVRTKEDA